MTDIIYLFARNALTLNSYSYIYIYIYKTTEILNNTFKTLLYITL